MTHDTESERGLPELPVQCLMYGGGARFGATVTAYYSADQMRAYAIAAIEKDRAERSEAVPVVEYQLLRVVYEEARRVLRFNGVDRERMGAAIDTLDFAIEQVKQFDGGNYEGPPERSDASRPSPVAHDGDWVMVPREPTPKMIDATFNHVEEVQAAPESHNKRNARIYKAMIAAAPLSAPKADEEKGK